MVNKIILIGYVGKDPEVRHLDNNLVRARFSLATTERWTNKEGVASEHTEWFSVVVWRGLAELAEKHVRKGSLLYVEGRLRSYTYDDKDGNKRNAYEVTADTFTFVGAKPENKSTTTKAELPSVETTELDAETGSDLPF